MLLTLVMLLGIVVLVVRALARPVPPNPPETERITTFTRVPWSPKHIDVPVRRKRLETKNDQER